MLTIKKAFGGSMLKNADDIVALSDILWKMGTIREIKEKVTPELFNVHICTNVIGMWQGDGWFEIVANNPEMLQYIPKAMNALGLSQIGEAFQDLLTLFPPFATFTYGDLHIEIINFLENSRRRVDDERLNQYSKEERTEFSKQYENKLGVLEDYSNKLWSYNVPEDKVWGTVLDYIRRHFSD